MTGILHRPVFQQPYVSERDGILELLEEPAAGISTICLRGEESCDFYVEGYDGYNYDGLLWLAREGPEDVTATLLELEERFTLGWTTGWLSTERGEAAISGFTVGIKRNDGDTFYIMVPLHPSDRARFLPTALTWAAFGKPEHGNTLIPPPQPTPQLASADCDGLYDAEECIEYASCECGDEPDCAASPQYPGIQECMRAGDCRDAKCDWAHCMTTHEQSCEHWYAIGVKQSITCAVVHIAELALCLPDPLIDKLEN